jgi:hypothetical protein
MSGLRVAVLRRAPTLPLREGRRAKRSGEGCAKRPCSGPLPEKSRASLGFFDPPSRGGWVQNSSCYVLILCLYSQNDRKSRHSRLPARRAPRGGFARAAQAACPQGEGGGGGRIRSRNYVADQPPETRRAKGETACRGASRQPQRVQTWRPVRGLPRALQSHPHDCPQAERALRARHRHDERRQRSRRSHGAAYSRRADARRLAGRRSGAAR